MNKSSIKRILKSAAGGAEFITQNEVKKCMGWGNTRTIETLKQLDCIRRSRTKQYSIEEVAARIFEEIERGTQAVPERKGS